ncbi:hypothetical protein LguiA_034757 [Lonicera macranthoides]
MNLVNVSNYRLSQGVCNHATSRDMLKDHLLLRNHVTKKMVGFPWNLLTRSTA